MEWLKKTWKFLVGALVTIVGVILLSKRKDDTPEIIRETTKNGNELTEKILKSNEESKQQIADAEEEHKQRLKKIESFYERKKEAISNVGREKIEKALNSGSDDAAEKATSYISSYLGARNLDIEDIEGDK